MPELSQVKTFAGTFRHTVDSKNRVTIPAMWRTGEEEEFFASEGLAGEYIILYPPAVFQRKREILRDNQTISPHDKRIYARRFFAKAQSVVTDRQGRILIPADLAQKIGIGTEAYLLGTDDRIEIWPIARYDTVSQEEEVTYQQVANLIGD